MNSENQSRWLVRRTARLGGVIALVSVLFALMAAAALAAPDAPLGKSSIGDCVWEDLNVDAIEQGTESGINDVTVLLYREVTTSTNASGFDSGDLLVQTTTTVVSATTTGACDTGGYYNFNVSGLEKYYVQIDPAEFQPGGTLEDYVWTNRFQDPPSSQASNPPSSEPYFDPNRVYYTVDLSSDVQVAVSDADFGLAKADARVLIKPNQAFNEVNDSHTFTIVVESRIGSLPWVKEENENPAVTVKNSGGSTVTPSTNTCAAPGTNASGECYVTVNSSTPDVFTANASVNASILLNGPIPGAPPSSPSPPFSPITVNRLRDTDPATSTPNGPDPGDQTTTPATKTYVDLRIKLDPLNDNNEVGDPHTFTATVERKIGSGPWATVSSATVNFALVNNSASASFTGGSSCVTGGAGTCTIQINATQAGSVDLDATTTVSVSGINITRQTGTTPNTPSGNGGTNDAKKNYYDLRIKLSPLNDNNAVGDPHTFTALVEQSTSNGVWATVSGATVNFALVNNTASASFTGGSSCVTGGAGTCTIQINATQAGSVDLDATTTVNVGSGPAVSITRQTGTAPNTPSGNGGTNDAKKNYYDLRIKLSPLNDNNAVGDPHTFTALVEQSTSNGVWTAVSGATVNFALVNNSASASFTGGSSCVTGGAGTCTIQINANQSGSVELDATTTVNVGSGPAVSITRQTGTAPNTPSGNGGTNDAKKNYYDLRIKLSPLTDFNEVNDPHTFTALVEQSTNNGVWAAVSGATVNFALVNNSANASFTGGSSCVTGGAGTCTIQINGTQAGSVELDATTTVNVGSGPAVSITRQTGTAPNTPSGNGGTNDAKKTYVDLRIKIDPQSAVNSIKDSHTFTVTVEQNTGSGWVPVVPVGTKPVVQINPAPDLGTTDNCAASGTDANGQCTVVINSGSVNTFTANASLTNFTISGTGVTLSRDTNPATGNIPNGQGGSGPATKEYKSGSIGDYVWWDSDNNGVQDAGEQGLNGVTVRLYSNGTCAAGAGQPVATTTTANGGSPATDGYYNFGNLASGTYCVEIVRTGSILAGPGWDLTTPNVGDTGPGSPGDALDSDAQRISSRDLIQSISLDVVSPTAASPKDDPTNDAGYKFATDYVITKTQTSDVDGLGIRTGDTLSFTVRITNTGPGWLATVPMTDSFDTEYLIFGNSQVIGPAGSNSGAAAQPTATIGNFGPSSYVSPQTKVWPDLTDIPGVTSNGQLAPGQSLTIIVSFTGINDTKPITPSQLPCVAAEETCNTAGVSGPPGQGGPTPDPDGPNPPGPQNLDPQGKLPIKEAHDDIKVVDPTAISLADSTVQINAGSVMIRWTTVNEANIVAFNVYRIDANGKTLIDSMAAQRPGQAAGATYEVVDSTNIFGRAVMYQLEAMMADGGVDANILAEVKWTFLPLAIR